jgi:nitrate/TMAO reductase-like tetraheme cytochrome c subunit
MPLRPNRSRLRRLSRALQTLLVVGVLAVGGLALSMLGTLEYTAKPDFCRSCHLMEPYYQSWKNSAHGNVPCIECHYEPGSIETMEGKFKALSQLAKYATRTEGTRPWAEISDQSCMRSGCHYTRLLEGEIPFGRVKFDHRHHVLESRRGRRLRCTSCHSQVMQDSHMSVSPSVCFTCHFKPEPDGGLPAMSDCTTCHGAPRETIDVAGKPFVHEEYTRRNVECRQCHRNVVEGRAEVRKERCRQCHGEAGHIEKFGDSVFLHEMHVTSHKVECFECHEEIQHGLLPIRAPEASTDGCGSCHVTPHDANRMLYAGSGAVGVEEQPSRMFQTHVSCEACHTGRSGFSLAGRHASSKVAAAGNIDCLACHGIGYEGMLERWQSSVGGQMQRLRPLLDELSSRIGKNDAHPAWNLYSEARRNFDLVDHDGSRGAHNVAYALDALRVTADRIDAALALVDPSRQAPPSRDAFPLRTDSGCAGSCHLGIEQAELVPMDGKSFQHRRHLLEAKLDCAACHSTGQHGQPAFPRTECGSCHHRAEQAAKTDCATCHRTQQGMIAGSLDGFTGEADVMAESVSCTDCHGSAPDVVRPKGESCASCHDEDYAEMLTEWQQTTESLREKVEQLLGTAELRGIDPEAIGSARRALDAVKQDGSRGGHNAPFAEALLRDAARKLEMD